MKCKTKFNSDWLYCSNVTRNSV